MAHASRLVPPKYLTATIAETAVEAAAACFLNNPSIAPFLRREQCRVIVVVPARRVDTVTGRILGIEPRILFDRLVGETAEPCGLPLQKFAYAKALQLWEGRNDDRTDVQPHLLMPGDAPLWGGVKRDGIVVACSGLQPWLDKAFSGMVADLCVGLAYEAYSKSPEAAERTCIIPE